MIQFRHLTLALALPAALLAVGLSFSAAQAQQAQTARTDAQTDAQKVMRDRISITTQADCDFSRDCADAQARQAVPKKLAEACMSASGPQATIANLKVSPGSCASMGKGREDRSSYRCTVQAQAMCVAPYRAPPPIERETSTKTER